jgi:hypothetical protein
MFILERLNIRVSGFTIEVDDKDNNEEVKLKPKRN